MTKYIVSGLYAASGSITNPILACWDYNDTLRGQRGCVVRRDVFVKPSVPTSSHSVSIINDGTMRTRTLIQRLYANMCYQNSLLTVTGNRNIPSVNPSLNYWIKQNNTSVQQIFTDYLNCLWHYVSSQGCGDLTELSVFWVTKTVMDNSCQWMSRCTCEKNHGEDAWGTAQGAVAMAAWVSCLISLGFFSLFLSGVNDGPCLRGLLWRLYEMINVNAHKSTCHRARQLLLLPCLLFSSPVVKKVGKAFPRAPGWLSH